MALERATITNSISGERIPVLFNPEEYTLNKDVTYAQATVPGLSGPILQFVHGNMQTLEMELLVDSYEVHEGSPLAAGDDVRKLTRKITDLLAIDPTIHAPPLLLFTWGSLTFTCVLARANQRFLMFRSDGVPVRARLQVTFNEFTNAELEAKEIKRETSDYSKIHTVLQDETLSMIAWNVYGNPRLWRPIALCNGIANPRDLPVGMSLVVPHLPYRDPDTGEVYSS